MSVEIGNLATSQTQSPKNGYVSPSRSLAILAVIVFLAELASMAILYFLKLPDYAASTLLDGIIMVILILPGLYYLQLKPLMNQIDERDRVENALRASESLFRKVLDICRGVWIIDQQGKIILDPACYEI
jgi:PAS domain-containing protein